MIWTQTDNIHAIDSLPAPVFIQLSRYGSFSRMYFFQRRHHVTLIRARMTDCVSRMTCRTQTMDSGVDVNTPGCLIHAPKVSSMSCQLFQKQSNSFVKMDLLVNDKFISLAAEDTSSMEGNQDCGSSSKCKNGGVCTNTLGGHQCICPPGFSGEECTTGLLPLSTWLIWNLIFADCFCLERQTWNLYLSPDDRNTQAYNCDSHNPCVGITTEQFWPHADPRVYVKCTGQWR